MPEIDDQEENTQDNGTTIPESPAPSTEEGYSILFTVTPDGFRVSDPQPLPPEPQTKDQEDDYIPDLTKALKTLLSIVKEHPVTQDVHEAFQQGFSQNEKKSTS